MIETTIDFPEADVKAMFAQMQRAQKELGKAVGTTVKWAADKIISSCAASTKIAPKIREFEPTGKTMPNGRKQYEVTRLYKGTSYKYKVYAMSDQAAEKHRKIVIGNRGLAKRSWREASKSFRLKMAHKGGAVTNPTTTMIRLADYYGEFDARFHGPEPYAHIVNKLPYINAALKGGKRDISTAMARASRGMEHTIDRMITKKIFGKNALKKR